MERPRQGQQKVCYNDEKGRGKTLTVFKGEKRIGTTGGKKREREWGGKARATQIYESIKIVDIRVAERELQFAERGVCRSC